MTDTSTKFVVLDATEAPLDGINLVEANAGTGKTYSIVSLYLRLIVERGLSVERILVVSFTEAATAELRTRIRERLTLLRESLERDDLSDPFVATVASRLDDRVLAIRRLTRALQSFDEAAVHTIHGFCQRLLADAGFETGMLAETELLPDDSLLRRQVIDDFWRVRTAQGGRLWLGWLVQHSSPAKLADELGEHMTRIMQRRLAPQGVASDEALESRVLETSRHLQRQWLRHRDDLIALLNSNELNKRSYSAATVARLVCDADKWARGEPTLAALQGLFRLGQAELELRTKKRCTTPAHPFFAEFQALLDEKNELEGVFATRLASWRSELLSHAERELRRRKHERRLRSFDDLLNDVYLALEQGGAERMRDSLRYDAALIDEFQDTDPVQFAIFDRLFAAAGKTVYLVGDPKQAIYSFRGADVFAYFDAHERANRFARLNDNYRSTGPLVAALNALFSRAQAPFELEEIRYARSNAARALRGLQQDGRELPALTVWRIGTQDHRYTSPEARAAVAAATATEIVRLLQLAGAGRLTRHDGGPVQAGDIAVLVRTHNEGDCVRAELAHRQVASVQRTEQSVFATTEADDLAVILRAVARPSSASAVRAALATDLLGYSASRLAALADDDTGWQTLLDLFAAYHAQWRRGAYSPMQRALMHEFGVERRLLGWRDGRRRLTNLLHLEDLLQNEAVARHANPDELLLWMQSQRDGKRRPEQTLLRLESDENLVRIVTIHYAKGLQFPIVFAPFLYTPPRVDKGDVVAFHDQQRRQVLDLGTADLEVHWEMRKREERAEQLRLAYVALTRAESYCVTAWGNVRGAAASPLAWLLHSTPGETAPDLKRRLGSMTQDQWMQPLRDLAQDGIALEPLPQPGNTVFAQPAEPTSLAPRSLRRKPGAGWRVASFSALARKQTEQPRDYDALPARVAVEGPDGADIFGFPRGARAGRAMHTLFERIDFSDSPATIEPVAAQVLREHGFEVTRAPVLATMAHDVLNTALDEPGSLMLRNLAARDRVNEMEFYFPIAALDADALRLALAGFGAGGPLAARLAALQFDLAAGFMHGFIDLVFEHEGRFHIVDYKSNWLGNALADYGRERLVQEIARHDYYLQYLIYTLAVHRHLREAVPGYDYERHFGAVHYLFLRGMSPTTGAASGVFSERPAAQLITDLERELAL